MLDFLKIKDVITVLPLLIIYIVPGYVFIRIKNFICNKNKVEDKNVVIKSIVISYVLINFQQLVTLNIFKISIDIYSPIGVICIFLFSIIASYGYSMIVQSKKAGEILKKLNITTSLKSDTLTDIVDFHLGMWIRIFLSSEKLIYVGKLRRFQQFTDSNYHIVLSNYILYSYSGKEILNNETSTTEQVLISVKDNYRIELVYDVNSKKITD